jgi:hypothetical protein
MVQAMKRCIGLKKKREHRTTNAHHGEQKRGNEDGFAPGGGKGIRKWEKKGGANVLFLLWYFWMGFWKKKKAGGRKSRTAKEAGREPVGGDVPAVVCRCLPSSALFFRA